jgi:uncharacterized membrane protein YqjE
MWSQYKKTFTRIQAVILVVAIAVVFATHRLSAAAVFFGVMQVGALLGAMWGVRLKSKVQLYR